MQITKNNSRPKKMPQKFYLHQTKKSEKDKTHQEQLKMLKIIDSILPASTKPVRDAVTGVDYIFCGVKIDRKFGFYSEGTDSIKIRINKGALINESEYTMVLHPDSIELFPTERIRDYMKKNPKGILFDSNLPPRRNKRGEILFRQARISLSDLYKQEKLVPATIAIPLLKIARNETRLKLKDSAKLQELFERALRRVQLLNQIAHLRGNNPHKTFYERLVKEKKAQQNKKVKVLNSPKRIRRR